MPITEVEHDPWGAAAPAQAAAPHGTISEVEHDPWGASPSGPDQAQAARDAVAHGHHFNDPARALPITDSSKWSDVGNGAKQFARGAAEGAVDTVGGIARYATPLTAIQDIHAGISNLWNGGSITDDVRHGAPHGLTDLVTGNTPEPTVEQRVKNALPDPGEPNSRFQSAARAGGEMAGSGALFGTGGLGIAKSGARLVESQSPGLLAGIGNKIKSGINAGLDYAGAHPAKAMGADAVANTESGIGGDLAEEKVRKDGGGEIKQILAKLAGQAGGPAFFNTLPVALAMKTAKFGQRIAQPVAQAAAEKGAAVLPEGMRKPGGIIDRLATSGEEKALDNARGPIRKELNQAVEAPKSQTNMAQADRLEAEIPGFKPGLAERTGDANLLNTQDKLDKTASGATLTADQAKYDASRTAVKHHYDQAVPPAEAPRHGDAVGPQPVAPHPEDLAAAAGNRRVDAIGDRIGQQRAAAEAQITQRSNSLPQEDRIASGGRLRDARTAAQQSSEQEVGRLRGAIANPNQRVELGPAEWNDERGAFDQPRTATVNEVLDRRTAINQELRQHSSATMRTQADMEHMNALGAEGRHLDSVLDRVNAPGLQEYRNYYRDTHAPQFMQGASRDVGRRDQFGYGGNKVPDERVGDRWFRPNEESAARQFNTTLGHDPGARQEAINHALDDLRHSAVDPATGMLRQGGVARWMQKNERVLNELPFVRDAVASHNPDDLYARMGQLDQRQRAVDSSKLATQLSKIAGPGREPGEAFKAALNDHVLMRQLMNSARGSPEAEAAIRRGLFDSVRKEAPDALTDPEQFKAWLKGHQRTLNVALTPEHLAALNNVADAAMIHARRARPEGTAEVPKSIAGRIADAVGLTPGSAAASVQAIARGRTSIVSEGPTQAVRIWNKQSERASDAAWREALSNPEMAKTVAQVVRAGKATPAQVHRMHTHLLASGTLAVNGEGD